MLGKFKSLDSKLWPWLKLASHRNLLDHNLRCFCAFGCDINVSWGGSNPDSRIAGMDVHPVHPQQIYANMARAYTGPIVFDPSWFIVMLLGYIYIRHTFLYIYIYAYSPLIHNSYGKSPSSIGKSNLVMAMASIGFHSHR